MSQIQPLGRCRPKKRPASNAWLSGVRFAWGLALVSVPHRLVQVIAGRSPTRGEIVAARVLGVRQGAQAVAVTRWPGTAPAVGAGIDVVHAISMVALALVSARRRRLALVSASVATAFAAAGLLDDFHDSGRCSR
jgi:hypothetical protein